MNTSDILMIITIIIMIFSMGFRVNEIQKKLTAIDKRISMLEKDF